MMLKEVNDWLGKISRIDVGILKVSFVFNYLLRNKKTLIYTRKKFEFKPFQHLQTFQTPKLTPNIHKTHPFYYAQSLLKLESTF